MSFVKAKMSNDVNRVPTGVLYCNINEANISDLRAFEVDDGECYRVVDVTQHSRHASGIPIDLLIVTELPPAESVNNVTLIVHKENEVVKLYAFKNGVSQRLGLLKLPEHEDLYSRSKGLLETDILSKKRVAFFGLGSGGGIIAVELAKAGVGNFVLYDFDRFEKGNICRHVLGAESLGRFKTKAIKDAILNRNPYANVETHEMDIEQHIEFVTQNTASCDLIIAATDTTSSRFIANDIALKTGVTALFGRAFTRARGGDILRVRPKQQDCPCLGCVWEGLKLHQEEITSVRQAQIEYPAYSDDPIEILRVNKTFVEVGLCADILPISVMMLKLALVELVGPTSEGMAALYDELKFAYYIWANRREGFAQGFAAFGTDRLKPCIMQWLPSGLKKKETCLVCNNINVKPEFSEDEKSFFNDAPSSEKFEFPTD
jgi:molybdopterin/thiamine biosynthesis adenylyltransferase